MAEGADESEPDHSTIDLDEVHEHISTLIGRYERAVGIVDNLLDRRFEELGEQTLAQLRKGVLRRIQGSERFLLLSVILIDIEADMPIEAVISVLQEVKRLRNAAAHAPESWIMAPEDGEMSVAFLPLIRRSGSDRTVVPTAELAGHHERLRWATDWLNHIQYTDPHFETDSELGQVWAKTMPAPPRTPPELRG